MPSASQVLAAREGGQKNPDDSTVRIITLEFTSPNMAEPLYIVQNSVKKFIVEGKTYLPYYFTEEIPSIKPNVKPELTISFMMASAEQEAVLLEAGQVYPWPEVTRSTWEVTIDGAITKTSSFLYPMPVRNTTVNDKGGVDLRCYDEDLTDIPLNPVIYNTDDHPALKAYMN